MPVTLRYSDIYGNLCCSNCSSSVLCGTETITWIVVLQKVIRPQPVNFPRFTQAGCILQSLQGRATCLCTVSDASSPRYPILFKIHFNIILLPPVSSKWLFATGFPAKPIYALIFSPMRATLPPVKQNRYFFFLVTSYPLVNRNLHLSVILRFQVLYRFEAT
jgi:hypothetical protein